MRPCQGPGFAWRRLLGVNKMQYAKWFYDIPAIFGSNKLQGSITTSLNATEKQAAAKVIARHFYGQPVIGWQIEKISMTRTIKED